MFQVLNYIYRFISSSHKLKSNFFSIVLYICKCLFTTLKKVYVQNVTRKRKVFSLCLLVFNSIVIVYNIGTHPTSPLTFLLCMIVLNPLTTLLSQFSNYVNMCTCTLHQLNLTSIYSVYKLTTLSMCVCGMQCIG